MSLFKWAERQKAVESRPNFMKEQELREYIEKLRAAGQTQQWFICRMREICERNWDELPNELQTFLTADHD